MLQIRRQITPKNAAFISKTTKVTRQTSVVCQRIQQYSDDPNILHHSRVPTYHFQKSLPHLPIPKLHDTCRRYLDSQRPLLSDEAFHRTQHIVKDFESGPGKDLHDRLLAWDKKNKTTSYVSEPWFNMYLQDRRSLILNHTPFMSFNDETRPEYSSQLVRTTNFVMSSARFMKTLQAGILEPEVYHLNPAKSDTAAFRRFVRLLPSSVSWYGAYLYKAYPLDMSQYTRLFNSTRIPRSEKDELFTIPSSRHLCVMRNGHIYTFDVLDRDDNVLPAAHIMANIAAILNDPRPPAELPVGILTTTDRDTWTKNRQKLVDAGNASVLGVIDSAMFVLSLEDNKTTDFRQLSRLFLYGGQEGKGWFDKSFTLIVTASGKAACNFEHSWGDGVAVLRYFNEVFKDSTEKPQVNVSTEPSVSVDTSQTVRPLEFSLTSDLKSDIHQAAKSLKSAVSSLDLNYMLYDKFGKKLIKQHKISPDSFMQLAFQMAFHRQYGETVATYESCSTAAFKHGRTETIRPATMTTKKTSEMFSSGSASVAEMRQGIEECSTLHGQLTKDAAMGQGFDRHLFGLRHRAAEEGVALPDLYTDSAYSSINHNILSTSTLSSPAVLLGGFAPVVPNGYGLGYGVEDSFLGANVTCYKSQRNVNEFLEIMRQCFDDMHAVLEGRDFRK